MAPHSVPLNQGTLKHNMQAPEEFTIFSRLPVVIRWKIWQAALPLPRHVNINITTCHRSACYTTNCTCDPVPALLSVNRESRREFLLKYIVFTPQDYGNCSHGNTSELRLSTFWMNPIVESAYLNLASLYNIDNKGNLHNRLSWFTKKDPSILNKIKAIEVRHMEWDMLAPPAPLRLTDDTLEQLLVFKGLKKIFFTCTYHLRGHRGWDLFEQRIMKFVEKKKGVFVSGKAPEIEFREWEELSMDSLLKQD